MKNYRRYLTVLTLIIISFILGRVSVNKKSDSSKPNLFLSDSSNSDKMISLQDDINSLNYSFDKVYRCGKSMIYHPTKSHASFKRCKSKISELSISKAKQLGMRHCKCKR